MNSIDLIEALHRNGIISERATRNRRPLTSVERNIIFSGRLYASEHGFSATFIKGVEMEGERDFMLIHRPIKVKAKFAYYHDPYGDIPATASYLILESNHPGLPAGGNVEANQLTDAGIPTPKTPSYERWVKNGRKCFRGGN